MNHRQVAIQHNQNPLEGYRGTLVYRQEYGYKLITMMIELRTPDERSHVMSRFADSPIEEEAEHVPANLQLSAIDLYHFPVTDGMEIELVIRSKAGVHQAYYTVHAAYVEEHSSFLCLDVMKARNGISVQEFEGESDESI